MHVATLPREIKRSLYYTTTWLQQIQNTNTNMHNWSRAEAHRQRVSGAWGGL